MTATDGGAPSPDLVSELQKLVLEAMSRRLDNMFEGADKVLLGMSEKTKNAVEQRRYFDTRQLVRKHRAELARAFKEQLAASFLPGAEEKDKQAAEQAEISFDDLKMARTRTIEESIAVNNIATRAENQNERTLAEINQRWDYLIHERGAAASPKALAPATLCNAFKHGTQSLNLDFQVELVFYKLFEQLVAPALNEVYADALNALERGGLTAKVVGTRKRPVVQQPSRGGRPASSARGATPDGGQADAGAPGGMPAPAGGGFGGGGGVGGGSGGGEDIPDWATATTHFIGQTPGFMAPNAGFGSMPGPGAGATGAGALARPGGPPTAGMPALDTRTFEALRSAQRSAPIVAANYGDADLATELAQIASGQAVVGWGEPQVKANIQAADLVGRMFNGIVEDASVPQALKPQIDEMRFAVIKSAMADRSFFANPDHPIRKLVNELATMASAARTTGAGSVDQLGSLLAVIQQQFQVAARDVKLAAAAAKPLADTDAERFIEEQKAQAKARRQALIDKARQVVREVLQLRLVSRRIADAAQPMLFAGLAPLLGLRLLRKGMDSDAWRDGIALLEETIEALDPTLGPPPDASAANDLCAQIELELTQAGMQAARAAELLAGLRQGLEVGRMRPPPKPVAEPPKPAKAERPIPLLLRLLEPNAWFKVHDLNTHHQRWMKVVAQHLEDTRPDFAGKVEFAEFTGLNPLLVKVDDLLDQLVDGRSEPFDQSPAAKTTLADLVKQQQAFRAAA